MLELESNREPHGSSFSHAFDDVLVLEGRTNVPGSECVVTPRMTLHMLGVNESFGSHWRHWRGIKQVHALHCFERRKARI